MTSAAAATKGTGKQEIDLQFSVVVHSFQFLKLISKRKVCVCVCVTLGTDFCLFTVDIRAQASHTPHHSLI